MPSSLAIIIPAYKATFLPAALDSIAAQTCQDFTLYIGDDCSPHDLGSIVDKYREKIHLVYKRFDTNLGGKDLVAQWERCIAMTQGEPYLWLFSDDDVMEPRCVEVFFEHLKQTNSVFDLYHFNVKIIDDKGMVTRIHRSYPMLLDNFTFYRGKLKAKYVSLVVENIFSRTIYEKKGGFKNFDLAWGSDTATWILFSEDKGFYTMFDASILWRSSDENITPNVSPDIVERKIKALLDFFDWAYNYFGERGQNCRWTNIRAFINRMSKFHQYVSDSVFCKAVDRFCEIHHCEVLNPLLYQVIRHRKK